MSDIASFVFTLAMVAFSSPPVAGQKEERPVAAQIQGTTVMQDLTLSEADNGKEVAATVGQQIVLTLPENPSTGYTWAIELPAGVEQQSSRFAPAGSAMPGSGGQRVWSMKALRSGESQIRAKLWREWEGDGSVRRRFDVTLRVAD